MDEGKKVALEKASRMIPASLRNATSEKLVDIVLNSPNANKMPSDLAKTILHYWQKDQLSSEIGIQKLLEAAIILEPKKTIQTMEELGLQEVVAVLKKQ